MFFWKIVPWCMHHLINSIAFGENMRVIYLASESGVAFYWGSNSITKSVVEGDLLCTQCQSITKTDFQSESSCHRQLLSLLIFNQREVRGIRDIRWEGVCYSVPAIDFEWLADTMLTKRTSKTLLMLTTNSHVDVPNG